MKKLTAGIFATILGLTAIDAYAAIPTQNYVDEAMGAAVTSANAYTDKKVGEIVVPDVSDFATTTYVDNQDATTLNTAKTYADGVAAQAESDANAYTNTKVGNLGTSTDVVSYVGAQGYLKAADVSGKADKTYVDQAELDAVATANAYTDAEIGAIGEMTVKAYVDDKTSNIASGTDLQALQQTVSGHTTSITELREASATHALASDVTALEGRVTTAEEQITSEHDTNVTQGNQIDAINQTLANKANSADVYTKEEANAAFDAKNAAAGALADAKAYTNTELAKKQNAFTGTCPAGATCYVDATGAIQVAVDKYTPAN